MSKIAIYLGPSLDLITARSVIEADFLPPIKRGDLAKLGPDTQKVGIIDGEFFQSLAVSPMEILPLLDRGVKVYGASSMGALRAVECEAYGMVGVGKIFKWFRDGLVDADDEVALTYNPNTYQPTSEPLINIRFVLEQAVQERHLDPSRAHQLAEQIKNIYFPHRSFHALYQLCPEIEQFIRSRQPNRKREDALLLLAEIAKV